MIILLLSNFFQMKEMGAELPSRWGGCRDMGQLYSSIHFCSEQVEYFEVPETVLV